MLRESERDFHRYWDILDVVFISREISIPREFAFSGKYFLDYIGNIFYGHNIMLWCFMGNLTSIEETWRKEMHGVKGVMKCSLVMS